MAYSPDEDKLYQALRKQQIRSRKGFTCLATGMTGLSSATQLVILTPRGKTTKMGYFYNLPVALKFVADLDIGGQSFQTIVARQREYYNQKGQFPVVPATVEELLADETQTQWTRINGAIKFDEWLAAKDERKKERAAKQPEKKKPGAIKKKKAVKRKLRLQNNTAVLVRPIADPEKALKVFDNFAEQNKARKVLMKKGGEHYESDRSVFGLMEKVTQPVDKLKPNPWFPGCYGNVMVAPTRGVTLTYTEAE